MLPASEPPDEVVAPPRRGPWARAWRWVTAVLAIAFMLGAIVLAWPQDRGGQFRLVVVSGTSMEPTYHTADLLIARKGDYQVGDVVVYNAYIEDTPVGRVVHRLVELQPNGTYLTQGDNKDYRDPWSVRPEWIEGRVVTVIPRGFVIIFILRNPIFLAVMSGLLLTAALWPRKPRAETSEGPVAGAAPEPVDSGVIDERTDPASAGAESPSHSAWQT